MAKSKHFLEGKRVIVAGGGIAGLTFVAALHALWDPSLKPPEITVLERQTREASIQQDPYTLTLNGGNQDDGLVAIQQLDLLDTIRAPATTSSGAIMVWSDTWKYLASLNPKPVTGLPAATMRISRADLKRILMETAEEKSPATTTTMTTWRYGCACTGAEQVSKTGKIRVSICDAATAISTQEECDLLIAADGADSAILASMRPSDMELEYAGATQIGGISRLPEGLPTRIAEDYGLQMSSGEGVCCIYTPFDTQTVGWALSRMEPAGRRKAKGPSSFSAEEFAALKKEALKTGAMFKEPFRTIVEATDPCTAFIRPALERPPFAHNPGRSQVIFIGDANHVLSPFEFVGANLALKDGWDLAEQLCHAANLDAAVAAYDGLSIPRAKHLIKHSHERIGFGHSTGMKWKVYKYGMAAQRAMAKK